jgi:D-alanyl-D-alanine carboxypeptidase (penicillin-binding protein 5/6)
MAESFYMACSTIYWRTVVVGDPLMAPFAKGQQMATLKVTNGDQSLVDVPLNALEAVEQAGILGRAWDSIRLWIK